MAQKLKAYRLGLLVIFIILAGCASSRVEEFRATETGMALGEGLVLLGRASFSDNETKESFTDCMADSLKGGDRPLRVVPQKMFRDNFYPWFEPRVEPTSAEELKKLFWALA